MLTIILGIFAFIFAAITLVFHFCFDKKIVYKDLKNRHVVITGGSSGIGKAAAVEAAKLGAHVTIIGRDVMKLKTALVDIKVESGDNQKIQFAVLDVTAQYDVIQKRFAQLETEIGPIFMLINCAGMCICGQYDEMKVEDIQYMIDLNYFGTAYPTRCVLPGMKQRNEGCIVFVSSEAALIGIYGYSAYSAAKWAVRGLAEAVSMELVGTQVRLMLSFPPDTDTPGFKKEELSKPRETKLISGSAGLFPPEDIAKTLISDAMNGKVYSVYSISGKLMSLLYCGSIESATQVLLQIFSMGFLRMVIVGIVLSFHKIVRDCLKEKKEVTKSK